MFRVFRQYLAERFPFAAYAVLIGAMVAASSAAVSHHSQGPVKLTHAQLIVLVILLLGFFLLRVFDEHKDYEKDKVAHPERVLSRGLISLATLRRVGFLAVVLQLTFAYYLGYETLVWVIGYLLFSVAMRYEFGASKWLNEHIVAYAVTHNPVVGLMMMVPVTVASSEPLTMHMDLAYWLAVASFTSLGFEVGRKVRSADGEIKGQDTYTSALGIPRTLLLLVGVELLAVLSAAPLMISSVGFVCLLCLMLVMMYGPYRFHLSPSASNAKLVENTATLGALALYLLITVEAGMHWGVQWSA